MKRKKIVEISSAVDSYYLAYAFKLANEAMNIKNFNPILEDLSTNDNEIFIQDYVKVQCIAI
jgi:hypothetical protein